MQDVGPWPRHAVEDQQAQGPARHVHAIADGVGAEQAGILLGPEDVHERADLQRIDVLGVEGQALVGQGGCDAFVHRAQAPDGGEEAQAPAAGRQEELAHGRGHLARIFAAHIGDDDGPGVGGVVEGRGELQRLGPVGQARRARAHLGEREGIVQRRVSQGGAGHQHAVGGRDDRVGQGLGGIDPVAAAGGVDHPAIEESRVEPVDEVRIVLGVLVDGPQHGAPGRQGHARPPIEAAQGALDPGPFAGPKRGGLVVQQVFQVTGQSQQRRLDAGQRRGRLPGGVADEIERRPGGALHAHVRGRGAGAKLLHHRHQEGLDGADGVHLAIGRGDAAGPPLSRQGGGGVQGVRQGAPGLLRIAQDVGEAGLQPPPAAAAALRPAKPAAQLRGLGARERGGKRAVGGLEQVVALVEDQPLQVRRLGVGLGPPGGPGAVEGRLGQDERVVGDDQVGLARPSDRLLHETGAVVLAAGMDALAAPVDEVGGRGLHGRRHAEQGRQPSGEVAARHVAVPRRPRPAGGQRQAHQVAIAELGGVGRVLEVQQAEIVLAALADHGLAGADLGVGKEGVALPFDLSLQGACVGGDPDRRPVGLGPQRGRRQIAHGLADARAGFGQHHARFALAVARLEGVGRFGGELRLGRPRLVEAGAMQQLGQPAGGLGAFDGLRSGLAGRRLILPLRNARPDVEARSAEGVAHGPRAQGADHRRTPGPAGAGQGLGLGQGFLATGFGMAGQFVEQQQAGLTQRAGLGRSSLRLGQAERLGEPRRRRRAEPRRPHEGEELQSVGGAGTARRRMEPQPARRHGSMGQQNRPALEEIARIGRPQGLGPFAVGRGGARAGQDHKGGGEIQGGRRGVHGGDS